MRRTEIDQGGAIALNRATDCGDSPIPTGGILG
jgi:hypothetical protein